MTIATNVPATAATFTCQHCPTFSTDDPTLYGFHYQDQHPVMWQRIWGWEPRSRKLGADGYGWCDQCGRSHGSSGHPNS